MSYLALVFPALKERRLPFSRDQLMLLMAAINLLFLGLDTYLAHMISGTLVPREQIPVYFGTIAGVVLLAAGLIALRNRSLAVWLATLVPARDLRTAAARVFKPAWSLSSSMTRVGTSARGNFWRRAARLAK